MVLVHEDSQVLFNQFTRIICRVQSKLVVTFPCGCAHENTNAIRPIDVQVQTLVHLLR